MARLIITIAFLVALGVLAYSVTSAIGGAMQAGRERVGRGELGNTTMQSVSFVLLIALIFYVSIWGGA